MYERNTTTLENSDVIVTILPLIANQGERTEGYRSRVRREGFVSLEIEIPCRGLTNVEYLALVSVLTLAFTFLLIGIPLAPAMILLNGVGGLPFLLFIVIPVFIILNAPSGIMESSFTQTSVRITRGYYSLTQRRMTWKSLFQIMCLPSHFNDLESGQFVEAAPKQTQHVHRRPLQAQIVTQYRDRSESKDIKLGSISFAKGLTDEELHWLTQEINRFLQET